MLLVPLNWYPLKLIKLCAFVFSESIFEHKNVFELIIVNFELLTSKFPLLSIVLPFFFKYCIIERQHDFSHFSLFHFKLNAENIMIYLSTIQ